MGNSGDTELDSICREIGGVGKNIKPGLPLKAIGVLFF
jgi:hypothetical protein